MLNVSGKSLRVLTTDGLEVKTAPEKVLHQSKGFPVLGDKNGLLSDLRRVHETRENLKSKIDLRLLWEMATLAPSSSKTSRELAEVYFGASSGEDEIAAIVRLLYSDFDYFKPRPGGFYPVDAATVALMEQGRKQQALYKHREDEFIRWLQAGGNAPLPPESAKFLEALKEFAIQGEQPSKSNPGRELLKKAKITDPEFLFKILINAGAMEEDENLSLIKYHVPRKFSSELESEALRIIENRHGQDGRLDLTALYTLTIDDETTTDVDDAISFESSEDGWRVGVHIADAAEFILKDSPLDKEAHTRSTSIYLPDEKICMLPESLTSAASLNRALPRPAISVLMDFHSNGQITSWEIKESLIMVKDRWTYDQVDSMLGQNSAFSKLHDMAIRFKEERKKSGALILDFPRFEIHVDKATRRIFIAKAKPKSPSQVLVSEWMILANRLVAGFCQQSGIPVIYRTQTPPTKIFPFEEGDWVNLFKQRRYMRRAEASVTPSPHFGLGLHAYLQMTSPLRRYSDLAVHRQLKAFIRKEALPYSVADLESILAYSERWIEIAELVERESRKYWLLKFLEPRVGLKFQAVVLEKRTEDYLLMLPEFALEVTCLHTLKEYAEGDSLDVALEFVKPRLGIIKVAPC